MNKLYSVDLSFFPKDITKINFDLMCQFNLEGNENVSHLSVCKACNYNLTPVKRVCKTIILKWEERSLRDYAAQVEWILSSPLQS